jgi:hypothetical protein
MAHHDSGWLAAATHRCPEAVGMLGLSMHGDDLLLHRRRTALRLLATTTTRACSTLQV